MINQKELLKLIEQENKEQFDSVCADLPYKPTTAYGKITLNEGKDTQDRKLTLQEKLKWNVSAFVVDGTKTEENEIPIEGAIIKMTFSDGVIALLPTTAQGNAVFQPHVTGRVDYEVPGIIPHPGWFTVVEK